MRACRPLSGTHHSGNSPTDGCPQSRQKRQEKRGNLFAELRHKYASHVSKEVPESRETSERNEREGGSSAMSQTYRPLPVPEQQTRGPFFLHHYSGLTLYVLATVNVYPGIFPREYLI